MALPQFLDELSPDQQAEVAAQTQNHAPDASEGQDPIDALSPEQYLELWHQSKDESLNPVAWAKANPDRAADPAVESKLADINALARERGFKFQDIELGKAVGGVKDAVIGMGKWAARAVRLPLETAVTELGSPEGKQKDEDLARLAKEATELGASTETAVTGFADLGRKLVEKGGKYLGKLGAALKRPEEEKGPGSKGQPEPEAFGLFTAPMDETPEQRVNKFRAAMGRADMMDQITKGTGTAMGTVTQDFAKQLAEMGHPVDPQVVAELAAGDPVTFLAFPGGFKILTAAGKEIAKVASRVEAVQLVTSLRAAQKAAFVATKAEGAAARNLATQRAAFVEGGPIAAPGLAEAPGALLEAQTASQAAQAGVESAQAAVQGSLPARAVQAATAVVPKISEVASAAGQAVQDVAARATDAGLGLGVGTVGTISRTAGLGADFVRSFLPPLVTPTALRTGATYARQAGQAIQRVGGELIRGNEVTYSPRIRLISDLARTAPDVAAGAAKGFLLFDVPLAAATSETPDDTAHMPVFASTLGALAKVPRGAQRIVQSQLIKPRASAFDTNVPLRDYTGMPALNEATKASVETANDPQKTAWLSAIRQFVEPTGTQVHWISDRPTMESVLRRYSPGHEDSWYNEAAQQRGVTLSIRGDDGGMHNVVLLNDVNSAPHESFHAIQDALGNEAMKKIDDLVWNEYSPIWDQLGQNYVSQFLNSSGFREYVQRGEGWQEAVNDIATGSPDWRNTLTPEQADAQANLYLNREISAEVMDTVLRSKGPSLVEQNNLLGRTARILGKTLMGLGIEPFEGIQSEGQGIPVQQKSAEAITGAAREGIGNLQVEARRAAVESAPTFGNRRNAPVSPRGEVAPETETTPAPATPAAAASEARDIASRAPTTPSPRGTRSQREILQDVADAIESRNGLSVDYASAPGEPAGAISSNRTARRAVIEAFRNMPTSVRPLFEKFFYPERVIETRSSGAQLLGWTPEVFASNAHKLAKALIDAGQEKRSPYPLDAANETFTEHGWRQLYEDAKAFMGNQQIGRTGSGEPLVVPASVEARGFTAPEVPAYSAVASLSQSRADVISSIFGIKLPKSPRVGKVYPRNLAGQEVSEATLPGRTSVPVEPRAPFTGPKAAELGIEGREIMEVNPFRAELDSANVKWDPIEAIQRLNVNRIADVSPLSAEAVPFRANEFTLQAGFQPKEGRGALARLNEISDKRDGLRDQWSSIYTEAAKRLGRKGNSVDAFRKTAHEVAKEFGLELEDGSEPGSLQLKGYDEVDRAYRNAEIKYDQMTQGGNRFQPKEGDVESYHSLVADMGKLSLEDRFGTKGTAIRQQIEEIKNRNGGNPPDKEPGLGRVGPDSSGVPGKYEAPRDTTPAGSVGEGFQPSEAPRTDNTALAIPVEGVDSPVKYAGEDAGLKPIRFQPEKVEGDEITRPSPSYPDAHKISGAGNLWVRQAETTGNRDRVLLVQITPDLMYPNGPDPVSTPYYDKLYSGKRPGYSRAQDFWELPQWAAVAAHNIGSKADFYAVRNIKEAQNFLAASNYGRVAFSVMDVGRSVTEQLVPHITGEVDLGGYTDRSAAVKLNSKAKIWNSMNEWIESMGLPYQKGFDYRHFRGTEIIPRLELSAGCRHRCTFCTIDRKVTNSSIPEVNAQVDSFKDLNAKLVYLNDKTFGQSPNVAEMPRIFKEMKAANPEFGGFVIQTTAAQMKLFTDEFLQDSGIKYIELGVETYNDPILKNLRKPATEKLIDEGVEKMRRNRINFIPNIVIGFPEETAESYARTMEFLNKNSDMISHVNTYNLAIYEGTEISTKVKAKTAADADENSANKSFYADPKIHEDFAKQIYDYGSSQLDKPAPFKFQPRKDEPRAIKSPAIRMKKDGKVFEGPLHAVAHELAQEELGRSIPIRETEDGFTTNSGEFLNREEAFKRGMELKQVYPESIKRAAFGSQGRLESDEFAATRKFQPSEPKTDAGRELVKRGLWINREGFPGYRTVEAVDQNGTVVGSVITSNYGDHASKKVSIAGADVARAYRKQGIGEALYREVLTDLQEDGVKTVTGHVISEGPLRIRTKLLPESKFFSGDKEMTLEEAIDELPATKPLPGKVNKVGITAESNLPADAKFQPKTEAGKDLEAKGFSIRRTDESIGDDEFHRVSLYDKNNDRISTLEYGVNPEDPSKVEIMMVRTAGAHQKKGYGETLYREALTDLRDQGYKQVTGFVISEGPLKTREKLLPGQTLFRQAGRYLTFDEALKEVKGKYGVDVESDLPADFKFAPKKDEPRAIKGAAILIEKPGEEPKIVTGVFHADAYEKAWEQGILKEGPASETIYDGFVTNDGQFLDREAAFERARELKQLSASSAKEIDRSFGHEPGVLEAGTFDAYRKFQPTYGEYEARKNRKVTKTSVSKDNAAEGESFDVTHYSSNAGLSKVDPKFFGKGKATPTDLRGAPKSFFFVKDSDFGQDANLFKDAGLHEYAGTIPGDNLYDLRAGKKDVLGWRKEVNREKADELVKDAGYDGMVLDTADGRQVVAMFKPVPVSKTSVKRFQPQREGELGMDLAPIPLSTREISEMNQKQKQVYYPEAVVPKSADTLVPSDIVGSPLKNRAGNDNAAVDAFAKRLVSFARENESDPAYVAGTKWYSDFTPMLQKHFGKDAQLMAELLAATSPNTNPQVNFGYAYDALRSLQTERFKKIVPKFQDGLEKIADGSWESWYAKELKAGNVSAPPETPTAAAYMAHWIDKNNLKPRQSNGALYGMHGVRVLQVLARRWMDLNAGPKTRNFVGNLLGTTKEATIDVWADRTMRWAGYEGHQDRWRILPENATGVSDEDFAFGQLAFRRAAKQLGITPDALQGGLWFAEKKRWADNGWGRLDLGDFRTEMERVPLLESGFNTRVKRTTAKAKSKPEEQMSLDVEPRKR